MAEETKIVPEVPLKEDKPKEQVKKIAENLKEFAKKPNRSALPTSREKFLKMYQAEKDPEKKRMLKAVLNSRMFQ
jgi:hypothetical protein